MGAVVPALEFMLTLAAESILALYVLTYAMHCLLVVVRDTAAGQDEVTWPDEPFHDWVGGALHLVAVVLIWLAPVGVLARALRETWLPGDSPLRFLLLAVPGLWLFFPVALLSSLSVSSRWFVFRPLVVWNLLRLAPTAFVAYFLSALLAAGVAGLGYAAVTHWPLLAPVAAAAGAAALLAYARLLGRLAWKMARLPVRKRRAAKKARSAAGRAVALDPWAVPDAPGRPESDEETTPFGKKRKRVKGYGLAAEPPTRPAPAPPEPVQKPRAGDGAPRRPVNVRRPLLAGVFLFPGYARSRKAWLLLALGFLALAVGGYALTVFYTTLYGGG